MSALELQMKKKCNDDVCMDGLLVGLGVRVIGREAVADAERHLALGTDVVSSLALALPAAAYSAVSFIL